MKKIALVTYSGAPELSADDRLLLPELRKHGVEALPVAWDSAADWTRFDQIVLRSCWDYHLRLAEFREWLSELERLAVPLQNPSSLVRWNLDKRYLRELQEAGEQIPPTVWIDEADERDVGDILETQGWKSAVVKPTVSASAHSLKRVFKDDPAMSVCGPAMVQRFLPEVLTGEWSVIFIAGEFSHAVIKVPTPGDFRVQSQFGGTAILTSPSVALAQSAQRIVNSLRQVPLYARIDGIECDDGFVLMEVELIEPELFLGLGGAAARFAAAILSVPG